MGESLWSLYKEEIEMDRQKQQSTVRPAPVLRALLASGRRTDANGVVIGPWTASVRRSNELLRAARRPR